MTHILASIAFSLIALGTLGFIVLMLAASRDAIIQALGVDHARRSYAPRHPVRVRTAGRWQTVQPASRQPQRVAA
jgi:hypothetical protein